MSYTLGIDLGTTYSAAAINAAGDTSMLTVGHRDLVIPSVVYMAADGSVMVGEAAERRAKEDPAGIAREFKRRFGDTQPLILNGSPVAANDLMLLLAKRLVALATEQQGEPPSHLVVCHPANWGDYKTSLLLDTLANSDLPEARLLSEPEAAAIHDASHSTSKEGEVVAVYDLGGGTFDVAIMRKTAHGWELVGNPGGLERLGGIDFDSAILAHVVSTLDLDLESFDYSDPTARAAMQRLKTECQEAKHGLSQDTAASIAVLLPGTSETVRITRTEFETLVAPALARSLEAFDSTVASAGLTSEEIDRVLLVGGSSQIPLVRQRLQGHTRRPVVIDQHPKHAIALGAAASHTALGGAVRASSSEQPASSPAAEAAVPERSPAAKDGVQQESSAAGMYQLPHISEGPLPDFMQRRKPPVRPATSQVSDATKKLASPTQIDATQIDATQIDATQIDATEPGSSSSHPDAGERPSARGGAWFWLAILAIAGLAGGASYFALRDSGSGDGSEGAITTVTEPGTEQSDGSSSDDEAAGNTTSGSVSETVTIMAVSPFGEACGPTQVPAPDIRYRVSAIPDKFTEKTLNGRNIPGLGTINGVVSRPIIEFPEFSVLDLTYVDCAVDKRGRAWWGVNFEGQVVWASTLFIEVDP